MQGHQIQRYTEHQYLYDEGTARLTGVVTFPAKVRDVFVPGQGLWSMRAAIVTAYRDGEKVDEVVLEGSPSETEVREAQARMELALLVALAESTPAEVQA